MTGKPSPVAAEDRARLLESRHDLGAASDPAAITVDPVGQAAISQSTGELAGARAKLLAHISLVTREGRETAEARNAVAEALTYARGQLLFVRDEATRQTRPDPDAPGDAASVAAREHDVATLFPYTVDSLRPLGPDALLAIVEPLLTQVPALDTEDCAHARLTRAAERLHTALSLLNGESDEDRAAFDQLRKGRAVFDRAAKVHALRVTAELLRAEREGEAGRFLKAQEPGYAARRRAGTPIEQEPEVEVIDAETETAPPAPPVAPTA
jgi:hypothetical protein